jgi:hypothetical protein
VGDHVATAEHGVVITGIQLHLDELDLIEHREKGLPDRTHAAGAVGVGGKAGQRRDLGVAATRDLGVEDLGEQPVEIAAVEELEAALHGCQGIAIAMRHRRQAIAPPRAQRADAGYPSTRMTPAHTPNPINPLGILRSWPWRPLDSRR